MHGRRERRGQTDAAVAVPRAVHFDGGKKERQRRRGHDVIHSKRAGGALALRPLPHRHAAVGGLHPGHRLACRIARCCQRDRPKPAVLHAPGDARQDAVGRLEVALQQSPERRRVDEAAGRTQRRSAARHEPSAPPNHARAEVPRVDAENVVDVQVGPEVDEILDLLGKGLLARREVGRVDPAGGDAREDSGDDVGQLPREEPQKADLVGGARTTAAQDQREVRMTGRPHVMRLVEDSARSGPARHGTFCEQRLGADNTGRGHDSARPRQLERSARSRASSLFGHTRGLGR